MTRSPLLLFLSMLLAVPASVGCAQSGTSAPAPESDAPNWVSFGSALDVAEADSQKIMVFVYTDWCGFCRRMNETTFKDHAVLSYLGEKFASVRINAESSAEVELPEQTVSEAQVAMALGASGFPTIIFMEADGRYITRLPGYVDPENYLEILTFIGENHYRDESFDEHLDHGKG